MGASADRITVSDFLTPPELRPWSLAPNGAGRIGGVRLTLHVEGGETRLATCYQQVPLRVLPGFRFGPGRPTLVYLLNPTAGLMDGDAHLIHVDAGSGTRAVVVGQSATRIHPSLHGFSTQQWNVHVAVDAVLVVLPGPAIPFEGCRYYQRVAIDLEPGAGLVWGDIWLAGRYARGEASEHFQFKTIVQDMMVRRAGRLVFRDRFCWRGPWDRATAAWHFGEGPACGSLFVTGPLPTSGERQTADEPTLSGGFRPPLAKLEQAILPTAENDTCLRCLGSSEQVTACVVSAALQAAARLADPVAVEPWLSNQDLAPNHWFSIL